MFGRKKGNKEDFISKVSGQSSVLSIMDSRQGLDFLVSFFSAIRPSSTKGKRNAEDNLASVTAALNQHPVLLENLRHAILSQLIRTDLSSALTESGIPLARGFWQEFFGRLRHKLLPPLQNENDFLYVLNRVFFRTDDFKWVEAIPRDKWIQFFETVGLSLHIDDKRIVLQLLQSLKTLTFQIAQLGLEKEVLNYITPEDRENNPFVVQNYYMRDLEQWLLREEAYAAAADNTLVATPDAAPNVLVAPRLETKAPHILSEAISGVMEKCRICLDQIRENQSEKGASLHQTYILILLDNRLDRISILVDLLNKDNQFDTGKFVDFFRMLVRNENRKNSMVEFMSRTMGYLAYQIAEHKGVKGNKYITSSWAEYRHMLFSAMGGEAGSV